MNGRGNNYNSSGRYSDSGRGGGGGGSSGGVIGGGGGRGSNNNTFGRTGSNSNGNGGRYIESFDTGSSSNGRLYPNHTTTSSSATTTSSNSYPTPEIQGRGGGSSSSSYNYHRRDSNNNDFQRGGTTMLSSSSSSSVLLLSSATTTPPPSTIPKTSTTTTTSVLSSYSELALADPSQLLASATIPTTATTTGKLSSQKRIMSNNDNTYASMNYGTTTSSSSSSNNNDYTNSYYKSSSSSSSSSYNNSNNNHLHHRSAERTFLTSAQQERRRLLSIVPQQPTIIKQQQQQHVLPPLSSATTTTTLSSSSTNIMSQQHDHPDRVVVRPTSNSSYSTTSNSTATTSISSHHHSSRTMMGNNNSGRTIGSSSNYNTMSGPGRGDRSGGGGGRGRIGTYSSSSTTMNRPLPPITDFDYREAALATGRYNATPTKGGSIGDNQTTVVDRSDEPPRPRLLDVPLQSSRRQDIPIPHSSRPFNEMSTNDLYPSSEAMKHSESGSTILPVTAVSKVPNSTKDGVLPKRRHLREADSTGSEGEILSDIEEPSPLLPPIDAKVKQDRINPIVLKNMNDEKVTTITYEGNTIDNSQKKLESFDAISTSDSSFYNKPIFDSKSKSYVDPATTAHVENIVITKKDMDQPPKSTKMVTATDRLDYIPSSRIDGNSTKYPTVTESQRTTYTYHDDYKSKERIIPHHSVPSDYNKNYTEGVYTKKQFDATSDVNRRITVEDKFQQSWGGGGGGTFKDRDHPSQKDQMTRPPREMHQIRDSSDPKQYTYDRYEQQQQQRRPVELREHFHLTDSLDKHYPARSVSTSMQNTISSADDSKFQSRNYDMNQSSTLASTTTPTKGISDSTSAAIYPRQQELPEHQRSVNYQRSTEYPLSSSSSSVSAVGAVGMSKTVGRITDVDTLVGNKSGWSDYGDKRPTFGTTATDHGAGQSRRGGYDSLGRDNYHTNASERPNNLSNDKGRSVSEYADLDKYSTTFNRSVAYSDRTATGITRDINNTAVSLDRSRPNEFGVGDRLKDVSSYGRGAVRNSDVKSLDTYSHGDTDRLTPPPPPSFSTSESLRIRDPNPLKRRGGPSPLNDYDEQHKRSNTYLDSTRSSYNTNNNTSSSSSNNNNNNSYTQPVSHHSKSPHETYGSSSYRNWDRPDSAYDNNKKPWSQQQQQQHRTIKTPTQDDHYHRGMNSSDTTNKLMTDRSETKVVVVKEEPLSPIPSNSVINVDSVDIKTQNESKDNNENILPESVSSLTVSEPSGLVMALLRLTELETQMEYEYVKLQQLTFQQHILRTEYKVLEQMPIGINDVLLLSKLNHKTDM